MKRREEGGACKEVGGLAFLSVGKIRPAFILNNSHLKEWGVSGFFK